LHGENDKTVPPSVARYLANSLPNAELRFLPGEDHLSLLRNHLPEILEQALPTV
jgi:hypothetical protein